MTVIPIRPDTAKPARANRRKLAKAATHARAIEAARTLFLDGGYFTTTMRQIADRMAMSTGAIFANFTDKAGLWRAAVGGPAPDPALAEEWAILAATRPAWSWMLRRDGRGSIVVLSSPDFNPTTKRGATYLARSVDPATALRMARLDAEQVDQANAVRTPAGGVS